MQPATKILDPPLKWIGAGTTVISLVLGGSQITHLLSEVGEHQRQMDELRGVAAQQRMASDDAAAWTTFRRLLGQELLARGVLALDTHDLTAHDDATTARAIETYAGAVKAVAAAMADRHPQRFLRSSPA